MSKKHNNLAIVFIFTLISAIALTFLSYFYSRTSDGYYCSRDPAINAVADCSLKVNNHGLPLAYYIEPVFVDNAGLQIFPLLLNILICISFVGLLIILVRKIVK